MFYLWVWFFSVTNLYEMFNPVPAPHCWALTNFHIFMSLHNLLIFNFLIGNSFKLTEKLQEIQ